MKIFSKGKYRKDNIEGNIKSYIILTLIYVIFCFLHDLKRLIHKKFISICFGCTMHKGVILCHRSPKRDGNRAGEKQFLY